MLPTLPARRRRRTPDLSWIARLHLIPDDCRDFSVAPKQAELEFGVGAVLAEQLIASGMPHVERDGRAHFAAADLHYIGLRLGCATSYLDAMRRWSAALTLSARCGAVEVEIRCVAYGAPGTAVKVLGPHGRIAAAIGPDRTAATFATSISGRWPALAPSLQELLDDVAALDFCWMPDAMRPSGDFIRETRLADCEAASKLLVEACRSRGIAARTAYGLLLSSPYSTPHNWAEIDTDGRWVAADPLTLALLVRHAGLDAAAWPASRSPGGVLLRLADEPTAIVLAEDRALEATFLTKLTPAPGARGEQ
jgi:hypothetical protein